MRITSTLNICGGKPCIRGCVSASGIIEMLAGGDTAETIVADFDFLEREDIFAALAFAAESVDHSVFPVAAE